MNSDLLNTIDDKIREVFTIVYYDHIPDDQDLKQKFVTYRVTNDSNIATFEQKDVIRNYSLNLFMNFPTINSIGDSSDATKSSIYHCTDNERVRYIRLDSEDLIFTPDLNMYTVNQVYTIQYS